MGLDVSALVVIDGEEHFVDTPVDLYWGYGSYLEFRVKILESIDAEWANKFRKLGKLRLCTDEDFEVLEDYGRKYPEVALFVNHCDCDGTFSPEECKTVYNALKDVKIPDDPEYRNDLDKLLVLFKWASDNHYSILYS